MFTASLPRLFSLPLLLSTLAGLTACGGAIDTPASSTAAHVVAVAAPMPVADCEPQACAGLRIIDSNAETFRVDAARRDALALAVARLGNDGGAVQ